MSNYERFPNNCFKPRTIKVDEEECKLFSISFKNLIELYNFLKADPDLNLETFRELSSVEGSRTFAGVPYSEAVENLVSYNSSEFYQFLDITKAINGDKIISNSRYVDVPSVAGGAPNIIKAIQNDPFAYTVRKRLAQPKFIRLYVALSYNSYTKRSQVLNRAIAITSIVKALENAGYVVDLNTFELSSSSNEYFYANIKIKEFGSKINLDALYKTLYPVEFLRRILFRLLETQDVSPHWAFGYGATCGEKAVREILGLGKNDIYIPEPSCMDIKGRVLPLDVERTVKYLKLDNNIDLDGLREKLKDKEKILLPK